MVICVIVTHGNLAEELLQTARTVFGDFSGCYPLSNDGKTPRQLEAELHSLVDKAKGAPCVVFVDFMGGSCSHACMKVAMQRENVCVVSGVNLPVLLAFLNKRNEIPFENLAKELIERGHNSIKILDPDSV